MYPRQSNIVIAIKKSARQLFPAGYFVTEAQHTKFKNFLLDTFHITAKEFGRGSEDNSPGDDHNASRHSITLLLRVAREQFPVSIEQEVTNMSHAVFEEALDQEAHLIPITSPPQRGR